MMQTMTRGNESSAATGYLLVAFELSQRWWKVGFTTGMGDRVRTRRIAAGALEPLAQAIADAKKMFGLAAEARVISCYEAGRDGFWLHRYVTGRGDTNYVVDSASIEVDRRARRTKTDAVDLRGLLARPAVRCRRSKGSGRSGRRAPGSWRRRFLGGARSGMGGSSAPSSDWRRRCIRVGRRSAIAGLRGRAMRTCGA